jgi:hypothetical protein
VTAESKQSSQLLIGVERSTDVISRSRIYERLYFEHTELPADATATLEIAIIALYTQVLTFLGTMLRLHKKSAGGKAMHALFNAGDLTKRLDTLQDLEQDVDRAAMVCSQSETRLVREEFDKLTLLLKQQYLKRAMASFTDDTIIQWISDIPFATTHDIISNSRTPETGDWLLLHEQYQNWRDAKSSCVLWLNGIRKLLRAAI